MLHPALAALGQHRQFVLVRVVPSTTRPGKLEKIPLDWRTGQAADAHDPAVWTDASTAHVLAAQWGPGHITGYVLTAGQRIWCVDVDDCIVGGQWTPAAVELFQALPDAAVELSVSGTGLHFWGLGDVPAHGVKGQGIAADLFTAKRFIALTSNILQGDTLREMTPAITALAARYYPPREATEPAAWTDGPCAEWRGPADDDELIRRALASHSAAAAFAGRASFADLWTCAESVLTRCYPDTGGRAYDASAVDAALAQHLAFWTGKDPERIERLMRRSALAREKWNTHPTYLREFTISGAVSRQRDVLQDAGPRTADDAWRSLHMLPADEFCRAWVPLAAQLPRDEAHKLIAHVEARTGTGRRELKAMLRDVLASEAAEKAGAALQEQAAGRALLLHRPEDRTAQAAELEARIVATSEPGSYLQFAGQLARVAVKSLPHTFMVDRPGEAPPAVPQIEQIDRTAALAQIERVAVLFEVQRSGRQKAIAVPDRLVEVLLGKSEHAAPTVAGLVLHPVVLHDGVILSAPGLHAGSGLFLHCETDPASRPYSQGEAVAALQRVRVALLDGFEFASPLDEWVAVAGLFTGVQRRVLDIAPGLAVVAGVQSSGKTTLARRVHVLLTGRDMPASTFPFGDNAEVQKQLLSALLSNPAMVCFDNVPDGFTFRSGALAAAMTAPRIKQRVLGASRDADCPTNALFVLTGNNLDFGADEVSRWLVCRLAPKATRPEERTFAHRDVVAHAVAARSAVLRDVVGIVAGYIVNGAGSVAAASRFPQWDRMARQPIIWAAGNDVAEAFRKNADESDSVQARRSLLHHLSAEFSECVFSAQDVAARAVARVGLRDALERLGTRDAATAKSITHTLGREVNRPTDIGSQCVALQRLRDAIGTGTFGYRVTSATPGA